jgi:hyperosmotically inducible protein
MPSRGTPPELEPDLIFSTEENLTMHERLKSKKLLTLFIAALGSALLLIGCSEEGPAEKAGKEIDETIEKIQHGDEGVMEKAGRKMDETVDELKGKIED